MYVCLMLMCLLVGIWMDGVEDSYKSYNNYLSCVL